MSKINQVFDVLFEQFHRINDRSLTQEEHEAERKRGAALNGIAGNLIKISALSIQAEQLKLKANKGSTLNLIGCEE